MTELKSISQISSGQFPQLTDDVIDEIEDFLLYRVDSEISIYINSLVQFFVTKLTNFIQMPSLSYAHQHYQKRLLRAMRFFRHNSLNFNLSRQLEDIAFIYLRSQSPSNIRQLSYVFLIDHFLTDPNENIEDCKQLISWSFEFINSALQNITKIDPNLYLSLIYSIPNLYSLSPQSVNVPQFTDVLIRISITGIQYLKQPNFQDDHLSILISKTLKLCSQLITQYRIITNDTIPLVLQVENMLSSDEISFSHIYQNYLMVACATIQLDSSFSSDILQKFSNKTMFTLSRCFPYFIQMPLLPKKKISFFLKTAAVWLLRFKPKTMNNLQNILPYLWNLVSSFHGQITSINVIGDIIRNLISSDLLRDNPVVHHFILENLVSSLEIIRLDIESIDFAKQKRQFETENWLECNKQIITLIYNINQIDLLLIQKANIFYSTIRVNTIVRFIRYLCFLLVVAETVANQNENESPLSREILRQIHLTDFRDKMTYIFDIFVSTINKLHHTLFCNVLNLTMLDLLPKQQQKYFHKRVFNQFLKGPYLFDFQTIFFATITEHFDQLMLPSPPSILLMIIRTVFKTAFSDDSPIQTEQCNILCQDVYRFIIQALSSKNATLLELLLTMFHSYFQCKTNKFDALINIISSSPFLMNNVLRALSEEPSLKDVVSFLSLFLFPMFNMQQQIAQQQLIESWVQLFLTSIESPSRISTAIPTLYNYTSRSFAQLTASLKEPMQNIFVTSLITPLSKLPKEQNLKILLGKIPDIACKLALQTQNQHKKNNSFVLIGGFQIDLEIVFEGIKRKSEVTEDEINTLFKGYYLYLSSLSFFDAISDTLIDQISEYIVKKSTKLLESMYTNFSPPTQYAALYIRQKYSASIHEVILDDYDDFLMHIATLCYSRTTSKHAVDIISFFIDNIANPKTIAKLNSSLLHAAQFNDKEVFSIISTQILNRDFSDQQELQGEIIQHLRLANMDIMPSIRKTAIKLLLIAEKKFNIPNLMGNYRQEIFKNISSIFQNQLFSRFEFIFTKPFTDIQDPLDIIRQLMDFLTSKPIPILSKEIQKMIKILKCNDFRMAPYFNAKFVVKMIAKLILVADDRNMNSQTWNYIIRTLKDDTINNIRQFTSYFIKQLRKGAAQINKTIFCSLPNTISGLISIIGNNLLSSPEDIKVIRFLLDFSPFKAQLDQSYQQLMMQLRYPKQQINIQTKQMQQQIYIQNKQEINQFNQIITNFIHTIQHSLPEFNRNLTNQKLLLQNNLKQISKLIKQLKPFIEKSEVDISMVLNAFIDVCLFCKINLISLNTHFHYFFDIWAPEIISLLKMKFKSMWNFDLFLVVLEILEHPKTTKFRQEMFKQLIRNFKDVFNYVNEIQIKDSKLILARSLNTLCNIVNNLGLEQFDLLQIIHLTKKIINKLKKREFHFLKENEGVPIFPSFFVKYIQILLPIKYAKEICNDQRLFDYFKTKVMTSFIKRPSIQLFQHPLFNRRLVDFMMEIDEQYREELYSLVPSLSESKSILVNQILFDRYRYFPKEVTIQADFANYYKTPSFKVLILNFSAALLASNKCVNLVDLKDMPILTSNSYTHALAIHYKLRSVDSIKTLPRFFPIIKMLSSIDSLELDVIKTALAERLDTTPYTNKSSLMLYKILGQQNCIIDHTSRAITQYIMGFSTTMLRQNKKIVDPQFIFVMPHVFQQLACLKQTWQRLFELLLSTVVIVLQKMPDKTSMAQLIPATMGQFISKIDLKLIDQNLIFLLKQILMEKPSTDEAANQTKTKFLLQLIPVLANILFDFKKEKPTVAPKKSDSIFGFDISESLFLDSPPPTPPPTPTQNNFYIPNFFPYILCPSVFFTKNYSRNIYTIYQKALRESVIAGKGNVSYRVVKEMYEYLRKTTNSVSPPKSQTAFSTIASWIGEVTAPELIENLKILLEALKPTTPTELFIDLNCMKQPINQTVGHFIINMLNNDFPELTNMTTSISSINSIKPLILKQSIDLNSDCWKIDWFLIHPDSHITVFLRLISPLEIHGLIQYFTSKEMKLIISIILNSTRLPSEFHKFMRYYIIHFPKSSLAESFYTTPYFSSLMPYPSLPLYSNIEFLESINIPEDGLGLLKCDSIHYLNACSFLQLNQFRAAKYSFLKAMYDDPSHYFYGLNELRSVSINLSLHKCPHLRSKILGHRKENTFPVITLPFYTESIDSDRNQKETGSYLTSFISRSHIPFLFRSSLEDEVYQYIKIMQQPESLKTYKLDELIRISSTPWIRALDRNMMMTSNFIWRLSILNDFLANSELIQDTMIIQKIQEIINTNKNTIAKLLSQSGATRDSLEYFSKAPLNKCIHVSVQNLPRIIQFIGNQFKVKNEKIFSIRPPLSPMIQPSPILQKNPLTDSSFDKLKFKVNFLIRDFNRIPLKGQKWLDVLYYMYIRHYELIDQTNSFKILLQDLNDTTIMKSQGHISILLCMIKKNPMLIDILSSSFLTLKNEICLAFLRWLPQLICYCPQLPDEFIHNLIKTNACIFYITFEDYLYSTLYKLNPNNEIPEQDSIVYINTNMKKIKMMTEPGSTYMKANKMNKGFQIINEYRSGMSWIKMCEKDIQRFHYTVRAHKLLYKSLTAREFSKESLASLGFSSEKELILFCEKNPPVFKTDVKTTSYSSFTGFRFPSAKSVFSVFIEKDNESSYYGESTLRYVTVTGESKLLQIVSPEIYGMSQRERLFVEYVSQLIEKNVSSHTRSRCTYYPFSFMVHPNLLVTDSHQFTSLHSTIQPNSVVEGIVDSYMKVGLNKEEDNSPVESMQKKQVNIPDHSLLWWFLQGAEGSKLDFVFMRQSFASYYGAFSYLHFIFKSQIPTFPSIMFIKDRQKCCIPDFMNSSQPAVRFLCQTSQINRLIPPFVMSGSFATSWQIVADSLFMHKDRLRIVLMALMIQFDPPQKQLIQEFLQNRQSSSSAEQFEKLKENLTKQLNSLQQQNKMIMFKASSIILNSSRIDKLASANMTEETEKCDEVFPFLFMDHLIKNSHNALMAQPIAFSWV